MAIHTTVASRVVQARMRTIAAIGWWLHLLSFEHHVHFVHLGELRLVRGEPFPSLWWNCFKVLSIALTRTLILENLTSFAAIQGHPEVNSSPLEQYLFYQESQKCSTPF